MKRVSEAAYAATDLAAEQKKQEELEFFKQQEAQTDEVLAKPDGFTNSQLLGVSRASNHRRPLCHLTDVPALQLIVACTSRRDAPRFVRLVAMLRDRERKAAAGAAGAAGTGAASSKQSLLDATLSEVDGAQKVTLLQARSPPPA